MTKIRKLLMDLALIFFCTAILIRPLFRAKYLQVWASIESTFIADGRFLAAHWPHPLWQPLWYCGTRFDYIYPPVLRYGTALLTNIFIPVKAYHVFTALMFCFGIAGVYFLVRVMGGGRWQGWISAAGCALISPSLLFIGYMRTDAPHLIPVRLGNLVRYAEGPHLSAQGFLAFALAFAFLALRRRRPGQLALAAIFCALTALTNFYGATALAILYPILVWSLWVVGRDRAIWLRALAIPAIAYGLAAFWLTPSYLQITLVNLRYVSIPGNRHSVLLMIGTIVLFGAGSLRMAGRRPRLAYATFVAGALIILGLDVLGNYYINFRVLGEPIRLVPELDMWMILAGVEVLRRLWNTKARAARLVVLLTALSMAWPLAHFIPHAWDFYPKEDDFRKRVEYRMSDWMASHMPDSRTWVAGSVRFWWDNWHDLAEVGGGSDQGLMNPNPMAASWDIHLGADPEIAVRWLQSLGADAVIVSDSHSEENYHDFHMPYKFVGVLPVLFDDHAGNVIYKVPRRYASLARVVDRAQLAAVQPVVPATNLPLLRAYSNFVEQGPEVATTTHWDGADSISVHAAEGVQAGQSVLVQVTYDPAWHAYAGNTELPIRADAMDFMAMDVPVGTRDIVLRFEMPLENRIGYTVSGFALLLCAWLGIAAARMKSTELPIEPEAEDEGDDGYSVEFRALRALVRWVNRNLPEVPVADDLARFDREKLRRAEAALRTMKMKDADGDRYLAKHIPRLSKTLALVPPPQQTGRVLELGCYMQITPLLQRFCGYKEVRGAYYGPVGRVDRRTSDFSDGEFACYVDHFDVERDAFPYPDDYFDLVVAGEILEHMTYDPMAMLLQSRRVLAEGGYLLISTPNVGSVTSVAKTLGGRDNPQIFFLYERPGADERTDIGHVREYTCYELGEAVKAAGFEVELLFTTFIEEFSEHRELLKFLAVNGYSTENRGEQTWCLARNRTGLAVDRYPWFIYTP
jgi:SAM-dependent methyltransferase